MLFVLRWLMPLLVLLAAVCVTSRVTAQVRCVTVSAELERRTPSAVTQSKKTSAHKASARALSRVKQSPLPLVHNADDVLEESSSDGYGVDEGHDASVLLVPAWQSPAPPLFPRPPARQSEPAPLVPPTFIEVPPPRSC